MTAYDVKPFEDVYRNEEYIHGTGSGTIYVKRRRSPDGVVNLVDVIASQAPSTTDTYAIGSSWTYITGLGTTATDAKLYIKTAATTWTVVGAQS